MNFRTTVILIVLLAGALLFVFFANREPGKSDLSKDTNPEGTDPNGRNLVNFAAADVIKLAIHQTDGQQIDLSKESGEWKIVKPIQWPAESREVTRLLDNLSNLHTRGRVELSGDTLSASGLAKPRFTIEAATKEGKTVKLDVGNRSALGNDLYVKLDGAKTGDL